MVEFGEIKLKAVLDTGTIWVRRVTASLNGKSAIGADHFDYGSTHLLSTCRLEEASRFLLSLRSIPVRVLSLDVGRRRGTDDLGGKECSDCITL
jgi:hypothetical protein